MSDLAPFVAAAIRDKVVEDLQKENAKLVRQAKRRQDDIDALQTIRIVGNNESKTKKAGVYSYGKLQNMEHVWDNGESAITLHSVVRCQVQLLHQIELCIGGCRVPWRLDHCTVKMRDDFQTWWIEDKEKQIAFRFFDQRKMQGVLRTAFSTRSYGKVVSFSLFLQTLQAVAPTATLHFMRVYIRYSAFARAMINACEAAGGENK